LNGRYFSHLNTAGELITQFAGGLPFNLYLKQFFAAHKKYGSKDRRQIIEKNKTFRDMGLNILIEHC